MADTTTRDEDLLKRADRAMNRVRHQLVLVQKLRDELFQGGSPETTYTELEDETRALEEYLNGV